MPDGQWFNDLVSGRRRGPLASGARGGLAAAELPYRAAVAWRNRRYDRRAAAVHRVDVPVVSIGNLTLGGTGKTPLVAWVAGWLLERGLRPAIVSRGYGAKAGGLNDEARELGERLPDVPHVQNADRVAAAREAIETHGCQLILLDDGFQHRRLARDLDIVLLDATAPFGHGRVFPRGLLREPVEGLARADVVALSRSDMVAPQCREEIREEVAAFTPRATWCELAHAVRGLRDAAGRCESPEVVAGQRVAAVCGIGNPGGFRHSLERCGCELADLRTFPDHHAYTERDVADLARWVERLGVATLLTTHKDLVKFRAERVGPAALWAVMVEVEVLAGMAGLADRLQGVLPPSADRLKTP